jgi:large subunit ribosomal protein L6
MSRVGKQLVRWKDGTKVSFASGVLTVETSKVTLKQSLDPSIDVVVDSAARTATFQRKAETAQARALHGLYRALGANMVLGVEKGFEKRLDIQGVGFNAKVEGKNLVLNVGFNKPVKLPIPMGITIEVPQPTLVVVKGADKYVVGQFAADARGVRPPEPYKGKGVRYEGEHVRRKVGKSLGA